MSASNVPETTGGWICPGCGMTVMWGWIHNCAAVQTYIPYVPQPFSPQYGWICPRCGKVNAPSQMSCWCPLPEDFKPASSVAPSPAPGATT